MRTLFLVLSIILVSPLLFMQTPGVQEVDKQLVIKANDELLNKGNLDFADAVFADDYHLRGGDAGGPDMVKQAVKNLRNAFPDLQVEVKDLVAEGDVVVWRRIHTGTHQSEIAGVAATGKKLEWQSIIYSRFEDGKVVEEWGIGNLQQKLQQAK